MVNLLILKVYRKKKKGNITITVLVLLAILSILSVFLLTTAETNKLSIYLTNAKKQSNEAADYSLKKYIDEERSKNTKNISQDRSGILGEDSKSKVTWEVTENSFDILEGRNFMNLDPNIKNTDIYSIYPKVSEVWKKEYELPNKYPSVLSGDFNSKVNFSNFKASCYDFNSKKILDYDLLPASVSSANELNISDTDIKFFKSYTVDNTNLNLFETVYIIATNDGPNTIIKIYSSYQGQVGIDLIKEYTLPYNARTIDFTGNYSKDMNSTVSYINIYSEDKKLHCFELVNENTDLKEIYTSSSAINLKNTAITSIWNSSIKEEEFYLSYFDNSNCYNIFKITGGELHSIHYSSSIPTSGDISKNYCLGAVFDKSTMSTYIYITYQSWATTIKTYRTLSDLNSAWDYLGEEDIGSIGMLYISGIDSDKSSIKLLNSSGEIMYLKRSNITLIGKTYKKQGGQDYLVSTTKKDATIDIEYHNENGEIKIAKVDIVSLK